MITSASSFSPELAVLVAASVLFENVAMDETHSLCLFCHSSFVSEKFLYKKNIKKQVAMGVPLINAIYEDNPLVGLYTLPLLIWHPMQLVIGSYLAPKLFQWVQDEKIRLGIEGDDDDNNDDVNTAKVNTKEDKQLNGMGQSMTNQTEKTVGETQKEEVVVNV